MDEWIFYEDDDFKFSRGLAGDGKTIWNFPFYIKKAGTRYAFSPDEAIKINQKINRDLEKSGLNIGSAHLAICLGSIYRLMTPGDSDLQSCFYRFVCE